MDCCLSRKTERLRGGYTLVARTGRTIDQTSLAHATVHTDADSLTATRYLPQSATIQYHTSSHAAFAVCTPSDVALLDWEDVTEEHALALVVGGEGKEPIFRLPTLYGQTTPEQDTSLHTLEMHLKGFVNDTSTAKVQ